MYLQALNPPMGKLEGYQSMLACGGAPAHSGVEVSLRVGEGTSLSDWSNASITGSKGKQQSHKKDGGVKSFSRFHFLHLPASSEEAGGLRPPRFC